MYVKILKGIIKLIWSNVYKSVKLKFHILINFYVNLSIHNQNRSFDEILLIVWFSISFVIFLMFMVFLKRNNDWLKYYNLLNFWSC